MRKVIAGFILSIFLVGNLIVLNLPLLAAEKVTLRVWPLGTIDPKGPTKANAGGRALHERFEELFPSIQLKIETPIAAFGQTPESMAKLMTAIAAGTAPDVSALDRFITVSWAARGLLEPLDKWAKDSKIYEPENFPPAAWEEAQGLDGKFYSVPDLYDSTGFWSLYWNKKIFREAGLDPNSPPRTWDETILYAKKLTKYDSAGRIVQLGYRPYPDWGGHLNNYSRSNLADFVSPDGKTVLLDSPKVVETLEWIVKWVDALGGIEKVGPFLQTVLPGAQDPFLMGKVGLYDMGEWALEDMARYAPDLEFGVDFIPTPTGEKPTAWIGGWGIVMLRGSQHPEEAWTYMEFVMSHEAAEAWVKGAVKYMKARNLVPVMPGATWFGYKDLQDLWLPQVKEELPYVYEAIGHFRTAGERAYKVYARERNVIPAELWKAQGDATEAAIYHKQTPKEALAAQNEKLQKLLNEFYETD